MLRMEDALAEITAAHDRGDCTTVLSVGAASETDLANPVEFPERRFLEYQILDFMARSYSRTGDLANAIVYFEREAAIHERLSAYKMQARCLNNVASMQHASGKPLEAKVAFEKVQRIGEQGGYFEMYAKACCGLSDIALRDGRKEEAMTLAKESLTACGLMEDGDFGKDRDSSNALVCIIRASEIESESFDDTLLNRLELLAKTIDSSEKGGSNHIVLYSAYASKRHFAMGRLVEGKAQCLEVIRLSKQDRFSQSTTVKNMALNAFEMLNDVEYMLGGLGLM